jgi:hypothetical protein
MMQTDLHDCRPPDDHDPQAQRRIIVSHVRVNVTQKDGNKTLLIPSTMHKIMNSLRDVDNKVTFEDIQRKPLATFDNSFGTVIKEGRSTQVILGTIKSSSTLGSLKQAIMPVFQCLGTYMRPHLSTIWEPLDTITIGHLHLVHPTFADTDDLKTKMTQQLQDTVARIQDDPEYHDNVSAEFEHDGSFIPPRGYVLSRLRPRQTGYNQGHF